MGRTPCGLAKYSLPVEARTTGEQLKECWQAERTSPRQAAQGRECVAISEDALRHTAVRETSHGGNSVIPQGFS